MKTGVVFEKSEKKAVIMIADGSFETVQAKKEWNTGDIVRIKEKMSLKMLPMAACIVLFLLAGISGQMYFTKAMVISVDVNPSIEFNVNRFGRVISVKGYNQETEKLIRETKFEYHTYEDAISKMIQNKYLSEKLDLNEYMLITVQSDKKENEEKVLGNLKTTVEKEVLESHPKTQIEYCEVDNETIEEAHTNGMTAGHYSKIQELIQMNPEVTIEEYSHCGVSEINREIERCHEGNNNSEQKNESGHKKNGSNGHGNGHHHE